jgi:thiamine biosynthesis protein ThiS
VRIRLNGGEHETSAATIGALLEELALPRQTVMVERNGEAAPREQWGATALKDGDVIEVLRVAAGG